ncbi:DUF763 domain-containing protein [candidate division WWE3 bacterium CG09_land_8_20_14_0_10_47_33]|uniref:DUF763 domain-containing protein n=1 Tax=candidate division WWE3 bacterium CG_4_9_14_0_2_um_filter_48_10 TaxID=1975078 RepID=A0A2M8EK17_UNCKA|nr:MAG: DUF763 domain-containing protein [candidate division WWE3 bacterium CG09_land_8_20_14_0_10_47_33]PIZ41060.1 MAG: DUF763 domain-containing protein [candidate division WWE3 bacterium CG_4_10_14_0_2_um_filter_47_8]PJC23092.1 MAG: DUF763 domain-containing protein [candidate division WWE3 bacterium CG_4_9_14_0_2_um_filter_48_10]PJE51935.1 MAG: hypothetical protein COV28_01320 [candidate division WWE3 bacterium CG10_big_fil_rev_8_21_14_0_10_48_23]
MPYKTGIATFGLDYGRCPPWLFAKMKRLARLLTEAIVCEYSPTEFIHRMSDPFFFQSFGTLLAFDWDASGLTTTTTAAVKEALRGTERSLGIFVAGGKGKTSLKTPKDIENFAQRYSFNPQPLIYSSKMSAKVDNTAIQDGFQLYHHAFFFDRRGNWAVVQQGMDELAGRARRYHWFSGNVADFVEEPHTGITNPQKKEVLNLTAKESRNTKVVSVELINEPRTLLQDLKVLDYVNQLFDQRRLEKTFWQASSQAPQNFENLLAIKGVGPRTVRALSLISEVIYGAKPSYTDPARYAFAHGGKDGIPYFVDRKTYDQSIRVLERAVRKARMGTLERQQAFKKLERYL